MKVRKDYYSERRYHVCRICETPIARAVGKELRPLANKTHVNFLLESGAFFRLNLCMNCARSLDLGSKDVAEDLYKSDRQYTDTDPIIAGFYVIEDAKFSIEKLVKEKERFLHARKL
jgi:hypothetical protein